MTELGQNSVKGTDIKLNVKMTPIGNFHMNNIDWSVKVFTESGYKSVTINKAQAIEVDADNYVVAVDTEELGTGRYYMTLTAFIPDNDMQDKVRTEIRTVFTGVTIDPR